MNGIFKFILFLLSFVGLGAAASSKRKKEVKKIFINESSSMKLSAAIPKVKSKKVVTTWWMNLNNRPKVWPKSTAAVMIGNW